MAGKVTAEQVKNTASVSVDTFREAVNTKNPKNKGYVRFVPNGDGGVKIEKVNNKIDFMIGWRTNINAENNKAMRMKFAEAFKSELRWSSQSELKKLLSTITQTKDGQDNVQALSRKEIEAAFKAYDQQMNTADGRKAMLTNLFSEKAAACGLSISEFKTKYLSQQLSKDFPTAEMLCDVVLETGKPFVEEASFRLSLLQLEKACNAAVVLAKADKVLTKVVDEGLVAKGVAVDFGTHLSKNDTEQIRAVLLNYLQVKGLLDNGETVGTSRAIFEKFMTDVLPKLYEQGIKTANELGEGINTEAIISVDLLLQDAEAFMAGAKAYLKNPPALSEKDKIDEVDTSDVDGKLLKFVLESKEQNAKKTEELARQNEVDAAMLDVLKEVNFKKDDGEYEAIKADLKSQASRDVFTAEGHLATFTEKFLAERGIGDKITDDQLRKKTLENTAAAVDKIVNNVKIAAQIQHGETHMVGDKMKVSDGANVYIDDMQKAISEISNAKKFDAALLEKLLFSYTLPNIMNLKIELAAHGLEKNANINTDAEIEAKDKALLANTANACVEFEKTAEKLIAAEKKVFTNLLKDQVKKGLLTSEGFEQMMSRVNDTIASAHIAALEAFFRESPVDDVAAGAQKLVQRFKEKINDARAELKNNLAINALGRAIGPSQKMHLFDVDARLTEALSQGLPVLEVEGFMSDAQALQMLKNGALKRLYADVLAEKIKSVKTGEPIEQKFIDDVQKALNKRVKSLFDTVAKNEKLLLNQCTTFVREGVAEILERRVFANGENKPTAPASKAERAALVDLVTKEVLLYKKSDVRQMLEKLLTAPESIEKADIEGFATDFITKQGVESASVAVEKILNARTTAVTDFFAHEGRRQIVNVVQTNEAFKEGGKWAHLGPNERDALAVRIATEVEHRAKAMPALYAAGSPEKLLQRLTLECIEGIEKLISKGWAKFRTEFQKAVNKINEKYTALGEENLKKTADYVLHTIVSDPLFSQIKVEEAVSKYAIEIEEELSAHIQAKKEELEKYKAQLQHVLKPMKKRWKDQCFNLAKELSPLLSPNAYAYLTEDILTKKWNEIEAYIYRDPFKFTSGHQDELLQKFFMQEQNNNLEDHIASIGTRFIQFAEKVLQANTFLNKSAIEGQLAKLGFEEILKHPEGKDQAINAIEDIVYSEDGSAKLYEAEKALLDHILSVTITHDDEASIIDTIDPYTCVPEHTGNPVSAFRDFVSDTVRTLSLSLLHAPFNQDKLEETRQFFKNWIEAYQLSRVQDYSNLSVTDRLMAEFDARVIRLQQQIATGDTTVEAVLSDDFIQTINRIIDAEGATMAIKEWKDKLVNEWMDAFSKSDDWQFFDVDGAKDSKLLSIVQMNNEALKSTLSNLLSMAAADADNGDGLVEFRKNLEDLATSNLFDSMKADLDLTIELCANRYAFESSAEDIVNTYITSTENILIQAVVGDSASTRFPNGLVDIFSNFPESSDMALVGNAFNVVKKTILDAFTNELNQARTQEHFSLPSFVEQIRECSENVVRILLEDKTHWQAALEPALKAMI